MDPRLDRAQGPATGFTFDHVLTMDTLIENDSEATGLNEHILALLGLQNSAEKPSFPSMKLSSHRLAQLPVHTAQAGPCTSTYGRQALTDAAWNCCEDEGSHCQEFQATTLVATAISLGLDSPNFSAEDTLVRAIDIAASLEPRGEWSPEPDVVTATRRAVSIVNNMNASAESPLERFVGGIGTGNLPSQIVPMTSALASRYQDRHILTSSLQLGVHSSTILSIVYALVGAVRGADFLRSYGTRMVEESLRFNSNESAKRILSCRVPYPDDPLIPDEPSYPIAPSGPPSFEDIDSGENTRQHYFPSVAPHVSLKALHADAQLGRVVFLDELFTDHIMRGHKYPEFGEHMWVSDRGWATGDCYRAMEAARHMGTQVISLCPVGQEPNARIIAQALRRMNIVDTGPHLGGVDNGYRLQFSVDEGYRMILHGTNSD